MCRFSGTMKLQNLRDAYLHELKDLYSAESQLVRALPKMARAASNQNLATSLETHAQQTLEHVERLRKITEAMGESPRGARCQAMEALLAEAMDLIDEHGSGEAVDVSLIIAAQKIEHHEIAAYGSLVTFAEILEKPEAACLLIQTLEEEHEADELLTKLAEETVNPEAALLCA
jgi:ferritin-like metal-binding protein YciE